MYFGVVRGSVVATQKTESLRGVALKVIVPTDSLGKPTADPVIAVDDIGARTGDFVQWISKREASMALHRGREGASVENGFPVDAAITGIIDAVG